MTALVSPASEAPRPPTTSVVHYITPQQPEVTGAPGEAREFLADLFGSKPAELYVLVWLLDGKHSSWFQDLDQAAAFIEANRSRDTYIGVSLSPADFGPHQRLKLEGERRPAGIVGLWADLDLFHEGHSKKPYPPTVEAALSILPLPPSLVVHSGHGLQVWHLFKEPEIFGDDSELARAVKLEAQWIYLLQSRAAASGWVIDPVSDLTRVMRVPGTQNNKTPNKPVVATILSRADVRYNPSDFEQFLEGMGAEAPAPPVTPRSAYTRPPQPAGGAGLKLNPAAGLPASVIDNMREVDPRFDATWRRDRPDLADQTQSGYEMALTWCGRFADLDDQTIVDMLIQYRRIHGQKSKPLKYYQKTLGKARDETTTPHQDAAKDAIPTIEAKATAQHDAARSKKRAGFKPDSQATTLVKLAADIELFHTPLRYAYATVAVNGHHENFWIRSGDFRRFLARQYFQLFAKAPGMQALQDAISVLEGCALFKGNEIATYTRVAQASGNIYLDLCNPNWEAVEISPSGFTTVSDPPVKFRRTRGMLPLPHPVAGGDLHDLLRNCINVRSDSDYCMIAAYLLAGLRPTGPYPVLIFQGEQGSAKSTTSKAIRRLIDPNVADLRSPPRDERELVIAASNSWCLAFDNVSSLSPWMSDAVCRLSTGGGFSTRELYTDQDEMLFDATRPIILNGIETFATRPDLLDRTLMIDLPSIPDHKRKTEQVFWNDFRAAHPMVLGCLLQAVSGALRDYPATRLEHLPRMADFATWIVAAEPALGWPRDTFLDFYETNRQECASVALDNSPVARLIYKITRDSTTWQGSATELLQTLNTKADDTEKRSLTWPKTPAKLSGMLRRITPNLRTVGVEISFVKPGPESTHRVKRLIRMELIPS